MQLSMQLIHAVIHSATQVIHAVIHAATRRNEEEGQEVREEEEEDAETRKTQASILATCLRDDDDIMIERKQHDFCMDFLFSEMLF